MCAGHQPGLHLVVVSGWPGSGKSSVADALGAALPATVVSYDWLMSGLRAFPELWAQVELPVEQQRKVGWTLMSRVAEQQLRRRGSVVLDVVARDAAIDDWVDLAARTSAALSVIECFCENATLHRQRIENRARAIPGWYELSWEHVERSRHLYNPLSFDPKLVLSAHDPLEHNTARALAHVGRTGTS